MYQSRKKVLTALFVSLALVISTAGTVTAFSGTGSGSENDPYIITDWNELNDVRDELSAYYKLGNDLDSTTAGYDTYASNNANDGAGWDPIGAYPETSFEGILDGDGHKIEGLYINRPESDFVGLFSGMGTGSTVANITLKNVNITGLSLVGGLAGIHYSFFTVKNCSVSGIVEGDLKVGGLLGENYGMVHNTFSTATVVGDEEVGGLVGYNLGTVQMSYSTGEVTGEGEYTGGLIGYNRGTVNKTYVLGNVNGINQVGGLVGHNEELIENSYATGDVNGYNNVGGLLGRNYNGTVQNSYSTGEVNGEFSYIGGLIGYNYEGKVNDSFWDTETSGKPASDGGTGKTTSEMNDVDTFTNTDTAGLDNAWDFVNNPNDDTNSKDIWSIDTNINNGYPYFNIKIKESGPKENPIKFKKEVKSTYSTLTMVYVRNNPVERKRIENASVTIFETNGTKNLRKGELYSEHNQTTFMTNGNGVARFYTSIGHYKVQVEKDGQIVEDEFYKPSIIKGITVYLNGTNKGTLN